MSAPNVDFMALLFDGPQSRFTTSRRDFWRCADCFTVCAIDSPLGKLDNSRIECDCGGILEHMGKVSESQTTLTKPELLCPCDARCTAARGPSCDCQCGGENHGSGKLVSIQRVVGVVPRVSIASPRDRAAAAAYRERRDALRARVPLVAPRWQYETARPAYWGATLLARAAHARTWRARNAALDALEEKISAQ